MAVVFPHQLKIQGAENKRFEKQFIRENPCKCCRHQSLTKSNDIGKQDTSPLLDMVCGDLHGLLLELEELVPEILWNAVPNNAISRLLREMVGNLDVDMVRRDRLGSRPALIDNVCYFLRDVQAPFVTPAVVEPSCQLVAGVMISDVYLQLSL